MQTQATSHMTPRHEWFKSYGPSNVTMGTVSRGFVRPSALIEEIGT